MATINEVFNNTKLTENGDLAFKSTTNPYLDILFLTEYYQKHLDEVVFPVKDGDKGHDYNVLFAQLIRDPRFGLGRRDLGRVLLKNGGASFDEIVKCGRYDDLLVGLESADNETFSAVANYLFEKVSSGDELAKKWMPRYSSKNLMLARRFAKYYGMNKQTYGKFIKANTTELKLSTHNEDVIKFEQVPSLASIKYANAFATKETTKERYAQYLEDVKNGKKELKVSTTTPYDIYKNRKKIDADLFFDKLEKIKINCIPIVDTSGSMVDDNDSFGKALALGHYLAKCSSFMNNHVISFSSNPQLIELGVTNAKRDYWGYNYVEDTTTPYLREIGSMYTGDCSNTDFGAVMELLKGVDKANMPEFLVVLSDMEFDCGSYQSREELERLWKENGYTTKIVWWNLNSRSVTVPEVDSNGNVYISGYNPRVLKFLEVGFDGEKFLDALMKGYKEAIEKA